LPDRFFLWCGGVAFLQGVFEKQGVFCMVFCGEFVVNCVVTRGALMSLFWRLKIFHFLKIYYDISRQIIFQTTQMASLHCIRNSIEKYASKVSGGIITAEPRKFFPSGESKFGGHPD
jgi:hypothetical protein